MVLRVQECLGLILANPPKPDASHKTTLVVCPVSVISNWVQQIEQHVAPGTLKVALYHGSDRYGLLSPKEHVDVLIASYGTFSTDYGNEFPSDRKENGKPPKKKKARKRKGPSIFGHQFHRVILDEAHICRNTKSRTFAACKALQTTYRLCLTGTPLQNKPEDIHSLFSFLGVEPLGDAQIFRRAVSQPIQNGDDVGLALLRTMMAHVALRRNKSKLQLVEKTVELRSIAFPDGCGHKTIYDSVYDSAKAVFAATLSAGDERVMKNYMMILETLMRIRQACLSGTLVPRERLEMAEQVLTELKGKKGQLTAEEGEALLKKLKGAFEGDAETFECGVCLEDVGENLAVVLRTCSHVFCEPCVTRVADQCRGLCPLCRHPYAVQDMIKQSAAAAATQQEEKVVPMSQCMDDLGPSPKLEAMLQAIGEMKEDEKGVIFSQFTKFLDVIEPFLTANGYSFARVDGSKTVTQRNNAMKHFAADDGPRFILCSLHAAGTGITLNRGNHVFMMDTWWNISVENQAMDRVHRIGQTRPVRVVRFVMEDSIESKMIELQESKAAIGKGAMEKLTAEEKRKARLGTLKALFSIKDETALSLA